MRMITYHRSYMYVMGRDVHAYAYTRYYIKSFFNILTDLVEHGRLTLLLPFACTYNGTHARSTTRSHMSQSSSCNCSQATFGSRLLTFLHFYRFFLLVLLLPSASYRVASIATRSNVGGLLCVGRFDDSFQLKSWMEWTTDSTPLDLQDGARQPRHRNAQSSTHRH